jgi:hypothetical protein
MKGAQNQRFDDEVMSQTHFCIPCFEGPYCTPCDLKRWWVNVVTSSSQELEVTICIPIASNRCPAIALLEGVLKSIC